MSIDVAPWLADSRWPTVPIRYVARLGTGHTPSRQHPEYWEDCTIPWVTLADVGQLRDRTIDVISATAEMISPLGVANSSAVRHPAGTVILSRTASVGFSAILGASMATSQDFATWTCGSQLHPKFLLHALRAMAPDLRRLAMGSTHKTVYMPDIAQLRIPLPSLSEQRRIADFLDAETARIDQLYQSLCGALALLAERDSTNASIAFDGPGRRVQLRRLVSRWIDYRGATPTKTERGVPLITTKNISDGMIDHNLSPEFISAEDYSSWMRRGLPQPGDVLLTTEAPLGEVAIVDDAAVALAQRVILIRTRERIDSEWIYWYFRSPIGKSELFMRATGSTALGIKADTLRSVPIPTFDPIEERCRIEELKLRFQATDRLRAPILRQLDLLAERRQALITAAVTGQFDVSTARGVDLP